jgi:hypothetical protein
VLARAYQDAVWRRTKLVQQLRARLREYYPGFLAAFASGPRGGLSTTHLASGDARAVLAIAPSPAEAATVSKARIETALRRSGRQRRIGSLAASIIAALRVPQLRQDPAVEQAMRIETLALLGVLDAICDLGRPARRRPWSRRSRSTPTTRSSPASPPSRHQRRHRARRDRRRPQPLHRRSRLAGLRRIAPVHPSLGKSRTVTRRRTKNNRLAAIGYSWAFTRRSASLTDREHYLRRRERGDGPPPRCGTLFNRMLGQLHHCLATGPDLTTRNKAFPHATPRTPTCRAGCRLTRRHIGGLKRSVVLWVRRRRSERGTLHPDQRTF